MINQLSDHTYEVVGPAFRQIATTLAEAERIHALLTPAPKPAETKYTPGPWFVDAEHFEAPVIYASGRGGIATLGEPGDGTSKANARRIVQAVNSHDRLVEALNAALAWWHASPRNFRRAEPTWLVDARAALAAAKEKP